MLGDAISHSDFAVGVTRLKGNTIELCSGIPGAVSTTCTGVFTFDRKAGQKRNPDIVGFLLRSISIILILKS